MLWFMGSQRVGHDCVGEARGGAAELTRRPGASPIHTGALPGPNHLTASCKLAPRRGFPSTLSIAPERRLRAARSEQLQAVCRASALTALGGARLLSSSLYISQFVKSTDLCLHSPWIIGVLCVVNWVFIFL